MFHACHELLHKVSVSSGVLSASFKQIVGLMGLNSKNHKTGISKEIVVVTFIYRNQKELHEEGRTQS